jgi:hypothetical protein
VRLVGHGWVTRCNVCEKQQHAKWHDYSSGEIINPIALVQWLRRVSVEDVEAFRAAAINYVTFITTLDMARVDAEETDGNQPPTQSSPPHRGSAAP